MLKNSMFANVTTREIEEEEEMLRGRKRGTLFIATVSHFSRRMAGWANHGSTVESF